MIVEFLVDVNCQLESGTVPVVVKYPTAVFELQ